MDDQSNPQDTTVAEPQADATQDTQTVEQPQDTSTEQPTDSDTQTEEPTTVQQVTEPEEEEEPFYPQGPGVPQLDFNNLPVGDDNLIDPNTLAGAINQANAQTFEAAKMAARNEYLEQRAEEKSWDKAYEKHPELKNNKELRDIVHQARLGEVTDLLSRTRNPQSVKLPTPTQVADKFFKHLSTEKAAGAKQATQNTVIQASAHVETAGRRSSDSSEARSKLYQNINNPNKEVAKQARSDLLKNMLFSDN